MIVAVFTVLIMEVGCDEIIVVIAMRHRFMSATGAVTMILTMSVARVVQVAR